MELTKNSPSPDIFRKWVGLSLVGAALTRRCWITTRQGQVYPNGATILVGAPSVGKGPAIDPAERILRKLDPCDGWTKEKDPRKGLHIGPNDCTVSGLFDEFLSGEAQKVTNLSGKLFRFESVVLVAEELSALMHSLDARMMGYLIKFLNGQRVVQRFRTIGEQQIVYNPSLYIIGGVQPKMLMSIFPIQSFDMGLTARTIFVYSNAGKKVSPFAESSWDTRLESKLVTTLRSVSGLSGEFKVKEPAQKFITEWWLEQADRDKPQHPKLEGYSGKRLLHLLRLCMIISASQRNTLVITREDAEKALEELLMVERDMPKIFADLVSDESSYACIQDVLHEVERKWTKEKKPIPYHILLRMITKRTKPKDGPAIIEVMLDQRYLREVKKKTRIIDVPVKYYIPYDAWAEFKHLKRIGKI